MRILYYEQNEFVAEGRLLQSLIDLGLNTESLLKYFYTFSFINQEKKINLEDLIMAGNVTSDDQIPVSDFIHYDHVNEFLRRDKSEGRISLRAEKMINLLVKTGDPIARSKNQETDAEIGISANSLLLLLAFAFGLDALEIDSIYTPALPLVLSSSRESKWVEAVYETCQVKVFSAKRTTAAITWVAAIMLAALSEFEVPPFRFLKTVDSRVANEKSDALSLHVVLGELNIAEDKAVVLIQTNLDDMSPQLLSRTINQLFEAGALDIYQVPVYMKKNRLGIQLSVVVRQRDEARLANLILKETTTLGVNVHPLDHRYHAETRMIEVETKFGKIPVKQKFVEGTLIQSKPEYEVMAKIASEAQVSMDELNNEIIGQLMIKTK